MKKSFDKKLNWRINEQIRATELRVISSDATFVGVMPPAEALALARTEGKDLIEIAPSANPPVAKIIELGKFKYEEEKKRKKGRKGAKSGEIKEVRFSPFMADGDFQTKLARVNEFLKENNKVRAVVKFKGRQMDSKKFGYDIIKRMINATTTPVVIDMEPKFLGRHLATVISPTTKSKVSSDSETNNDKESK